MSLRAERGFILIGVIWLMILAGSIAAILMLRARTAGEISRNLQQRVQARLSAEAAIATTIAEILFEGPRSRWAVLPAERAVDIDGGTIDVKVSSEETRLDLNEASIELIDASLQIGGVDRRVRTAFLGQLAARRQAKQRLSSFEEIAELLNRSGISASDAPCLASGYTLFSGLPVPVTPGNDGRVQTANNALVRLTARDRRGANLTIIGRTTLIGDRAFETLSWSGNAPRC